MCVHAPAYVYIRTIYCGHLIVFCILQWGMFENGGRKSWGNFFRVLYFHFHYLVAATGPLRAMQCSFAIIKTHEGMFKNSTFSAII